MGGGAVIRAVAKVAGIGGMNASLRGITGVPSAEHPFTSAARPVKALFSNPDVQVPYRDNINDWELAGGEEESLDVPMLVFGDTPTLKEAENATFELKKAVNKAYLSPNIAVISSTEPGTVALKDFESKCAVTGTTSTPPTHVIRAFRFLNENTVAQKVVASIASDPNVWNAVLQNEALVGFLQSQKSTSNMDASGEQSDVDRKLDDLCNLEDRNVIEDIVLNMKDTVMEMMNSLSGYFQNLFGGTVAPDGSITNSIDKDKAMNASFMGLAVMVIMVVVLDRQ